MNAFVKACDFFARYTQAPSSPSAGGAQFLFDRECQPLSTHELISTGLPYLGGEGAIEFLSLDEPLLRIETDKDSRFYVGEHNALLVFWADEALLNDLTQTSYTLYLRLLAAARALDFPHMVRVWNYFSDINGDEAGLERYRHFCLGRYEALAAAGVAAKDYPSACALGHQGGQVLVYAWVSKQPAMHFENPQQQAAYEYPADYGPRSPSFARASLHQTSPHRLSLFLSGTASVVGHKTVCVDDLAGQIRTTLQNIDTLLAHISRERGFSENAPWQASILKIYVRHISDYEQIKAAIDGAFPQVPCVYVHADVCRSDLLFEMDGIWNRDI